MIKKFLLSLGLLGFASLPMIGQVNAQSIDDYTTNLYENNNTTTNIGIEVIGTDEDQGGRLIDVIKRAINWVLGMLALVTLILCLWGGFQMVTAGGKDDKVKTGGKILKNAAIGLVVIGLSWFIVTIIFWIIRGVATQ